jgi:GDP-4-dehydro-6-deoxy-D-mannose reductase
VKRKNRVVITGAGGFAGSFLTERLLAEDYQIYGLLAPDEKEDNISHLSGALILDRFDITNQSKVHNYIDKIKPRYIFHLAAMASVGQSINQARLTYEINIFGSLNILEAAQLLGNKLEKLVMIGSADSFGVFSPKGKTLKENQPFAPVSPYGISKASMEYLAGYYFRQNHLPVVIARSFNHTGPRQSENFVIPSFCRQIARIEKGLDRPQIKVGDLSVRRDLSDVRDIVEGYYLLAQKGRPGQSYHLASGKAIAIKKALNMLLGMADIKIKVIIDKNRLRKSDIPILRGDIAKARKELGWRPRYKLEETLKYTLDWWREKVTN